MTFSLYVCLCVQIFSLYKDTSHIWLGPNDLILSDYICNDPVSKEGHILRYKGESFSIRVLGDTSQPITILLYQFP